MINIKTQFTDNTDEVLAELERKIQDSLQEVGQIAVNDARNSTPVDTGNLRDSMTCDIKDDLVVVGSNVDYAIYVEEGTRKQKGHHMVRNAMQDNANQFKSIIEQNMKQ